MPPDPSLVEQIRKECSYHSDTRSWLACEAADALEACLPWLRELADFKGNFSADIDALIRKIEGERDAH